VAAWQRQWQSKIGNGSTAAAKGWQGGSGSTAAAGRCLRRQHSDSGSSAAAAASGGAGSGVAVAAAEATAQQWRWWPRQQLGGRKQHG
jgi:hypothetical protein